MNARWVQMPVKSGESWVLADEDDEVLATVGKDETPGALIFAHVGSGYIGSAVKQFVTIDGAKRWIERQLANSYTFTPTQNTGWTGVVAGLGVSG